METQLKKDLLSFIEKHNDKSEEAERLIKALKNALGYVELDAYSLSPDDLNYSISDEAAASLRKQLNKEESEPFTIDDCEIVSVRLADILEEDFGAILDSAIMD